MTNVLDYTVRVKVAIEVLAAAISAPAKEANDEEGK
jgi:hypothetical protein